MESSPGPEMTDDFYRQCVSTLTGIAHETPVILTQRLMALYNFLHSSSYIFCLLSASVPVGRTLRGGYPSTTRSYDVRNWGADIISLSVTCHKK